MFSVDFVGYNYNINLMPKDFIQLSTKPGYMKHNRGLLFREISKNEYEFKTKIKKPLK